ncbi:hypothetical protein OF83DRAFT_920825 [Amylostereum chailletii]|nr:hypothetical protein OF83DRAFT_920825 [Amylostereum chailletii]
MFMRSTNQRCNALQSVIGLFLHSNNVPERVIETLAHVGLSLSQAAINDAVNALSADAFIKIRALACTLLAAYAYDNFDVQMNVATPTVEKKDELLHLTSGTLIRLDHGVTLEDLDCSKELWEKSSLNPIGNVPSDFSKRTYKDLVDLYPETEDENDSESSSSSSDSGDEDDTAPPTAPPPGRRGRFQAWKIREDLLAHGPAYFQKFRKLQEATRPEPLEQVPVEKTYQVPLRALDINESTTQGNIDAILAFLKQGGVGDPGSEGNAPGVVDISNHVILFNADLATIERIQSLQASRSREENPWLRFQYVVAVPGLFHVKMACADAIWRAFIKPVESRTDHSSTTFHGGLLRPHDSGRIVSNPGFRRMHDLIQNDGIVRRLDCCREEILRTKNIASLEAWAETKPTWDDVLELSASVVKGYVANGRTQHDKNPKTVDVDFENSQIRHESYLLYEEITYAMNIGDIGRLEEAQVSWIFIFKGTGKNKYANQMLKFLLEVHFLYPPGLRRAVRLNWMCNPRGQPGAFRGVDWLVERNNLYTKHIYGGQFSNNKLPYIIKESILIELYRILNVNIEDNFCLTNRTIHHAKPKMQNTFKIVSNHMEKDKNRPHLYTPTRQVHYAIPNQMRRGDHLLQTSKSPIHAEGGVGIEGDDIVVGSVDDDNLDEEVAGNDLAV